VLAVVARQVARHFQELILRHVDQRFLFEALPASQSSTSAALRSGGKTG
jgi:hypothetical protein